jgi:hypothetical protein
MSQPSSKRDRDVNSVSSPPRPQPAESPTQKPTTRTAVVNWSAEKFAEILADDGNDAANAREFCPPTTIVTLLSATNNGHSSLYPVVIDTTLDDISVWYPTTALKLWTFPRRMGEGGEWAATNAFTRIDTIASGADRDWGLSAIRVTVDGPEMTPAALTSWALAQQGRLAANPHALRPSLS